MIKFNPKYHYRGKPCVKCGSDIRYIHQGRCVLCRRKNSKKWKKENPEKTRKYREDNRDIINNRNNKWLKDNKEKRRKYEKEYYKKNREHIREYHREWYLKNREDKLAKNKEWRDNNLEKQKIYVHKRRQLIEENGGEYTEKEWLNLCERYNFECLRCGDNLVSMTVDHIIPLSKGGSNHIWNIQNLCLSCNSIKNNKIIDYRPTEDIPNEFVEFLENLDLE